MNVWPEAASDFAHCTEKGHNDAASYTRRGMAEASAQKWTAAVESFGTALNQDENFVDALVLRGRTYCCMRKWDLAEADFQKVLRLDSHNEVAKAGLAIIFTPHLPLPLTD
jgi:tetratricopeptide (TPR) repeat protein